MNTKPRYAIFFAPGDDSPLGVYGATVLRRQSHNNTEWVNPRIPVNFENTPVWRACVERPAHYGFHATINAPFELADKFSTDELFEDLRLFCKQKQPLPLTNLAPRLTHRYDALVFDHQPQAIKDFAATCTHRFEKYRAPLTADDLQRRQKKALTESQINYLQRYGYPYVLDEFNFHMTLSGTMPDDDNGFLRWLGVLFWEMVPETPLLDRLCVFKQPDRNSAFTRIADFPFPTG